MVTPWLGIWGEKARSASLSCGGMGREGGGGVVLSVK